MAIMTMGKVYERLAFRLTTWGRKSFLSGDRCLIFFRDASHPVGV